MNRALQVIDQGNVQIALVLDNEGVLLGTVTDGDIRRGILKSIPLDAAVSEVMKTDALVGHPGQPAEKHRGIMEANSIRQLPIVDSDFRVVQLVVSANLHAPVSHLRDNWVVLMAGGLGTRLSPLTDDTPKPLLKVGNKPVLEIIIENFVAQGFRRFYISVNYKADQIRDHFGDGAKWDVEIRYLEEDERLGTAGALALIDDRPTTPFVVMNGDLMTKVNFQNLLDFHTEQKSTATMCVRDYDFQVPFGVVETDHTRIISIEEKPKQRFLVNAGIYVLDPDVFGFIADAGHQDMTHVFEGMIEADLNTTVFPIREYWLDIGKLEDFDQANSDFADIFPDQPSK
ncbi:MAG: nucleotidyltransferase family protein [Proteobacteria bacterium]|nr:nucleotidyltransferase family protein [Pseudomonadota bacterium]